MRIAVLASHEGSLLQAVLDACEANAIEGRVVLVLSNNSASGALRRARAAGVATAHLSSTTHADASCLDRAICEALERARTDVAVLAGYMKPLGPLTLGRFRGRIVNSHPALLPKFGGRGYFGRRVHEAVLAAGENETGATVHRVEGDYDSGPVLAQARVPVRPNETVESLEARVKVVERRLLVETLAALSRSEVETT